MTDAIKPDELARARAALAEFERLDDADNDDLRFAANRHDVSPEAMEQVLRDGLAVRRAWEREQAEKAARDVDTSGG